MSLTLITLISNEENPLLIMKDNLKEAKETKLQFSGLIRSVDPDDDGFRRTRVNKSKLNTIRKVIEKLDCIALELWCKTEDVDEMTNKIVDKLVAIQDEQMDEYAKWESLVELRNEELKKGY